MVYSIAAVDKYNALLKKAQGLRNWTDFMRGITEGWVLAPPFRTSY